MRTVLGVLLGVVLAVAVIYAALDVRGIEGAKQLVSKLTTALNVN